MYAIKAFKNKNLLIVAATLVLTVFLIFSASSVQVSAEHAQCGDGTQVPESLRDPGAASQFCEGRGGLEGSSGSGSGVTVDENETATLNPECQDLDNCEFIGYVRDAINVLSAIVGIVVVIMIAVGGIQYTASRDNPQATAAAKQRIINAIIALVVYLFMFAILEWFVPGGVFG